MTTLSKEDVVRMAEEAGCETVIWRAEPMLVYGDQMLGGFCDRVATLARADLMAENEQLKEQLNKHWKLQPEDVTSGDIGSFL